jgi:hypothetical protein
MLSQTFLDGFSFSDFHSLTRIALIHEWKSVVLIQTHAFNSSALDESLSPLDVGFRPFLIRFESQKEPSFLSQDVLHQLQHVQRRHKVILVSLIEEKAQIVAVIERECADIDSSITKQKLNSKTSVTFLQCFEIDEI